MNTTNMSFFNFLPNLFCSAWFMSQVSVLEVSRNLKCIFTTSTTIANLQEGTKQRRYLRFGMKASLRLRNWKSECEEPCKIFRSIKGYKKKSTGPQRKMRQNTANRVKWGQRGQTGLKGSNGAIKDQMRPNGVNWGPILNLILNPIFNPIFNPILKPIIQPNIENQYWNPILTTILNTIFYPNI